MSKQQKDEVVENQPQEVDESAENGSSATTGPEPETTNKDVKEGDEIEFIRNRINELEAEIDITAEAGTYIKEFVNGDGGRTVPSIAGKLGMGCQVKELDVLEILDNE